MPPDADSRAAGVPSPNLPRALARPSTFLLFVALYLAWQVVVRLTTSNSAELDEGEQLFLTQHLAWGYGPQPPLYSWLQYPFIQLFGPSILPLALFKHLLLFGIYALTYFNARRLTGSHLLAVAATISLLFVPQIAWESERDLTHSVLVTLMAAATFHVFVRLSETRQPRWYLAFGACVALGTLSKYSYLFVVVGLLVAAASLPSLRPVIGNRWMLGALALALMAVAPHALWAFRQPGAVFATASKFHVAHDQTWLRTLFVGLKNLAASSASHTGVLLVFYLVLLLLFRRQKNCPAPTAVDRNYLRLMARAFAVIFGLLMLSIAVFRVTNLKDRWLTPIFICLPVYLVAALAPRINASLVRAMMFVGLVVAAAISVLLPGRVWFAEWRDRPDQPNSPFDRLSEQMRPFLPAKAVLVAEDAWLGGNLRIFFPDHEIVAPQIAIQPRWRDGQDCVLVWDATRADWPQEPFEHFAASNVDFVAERSNHWHFVEAPLKFFRNRPMRLGLINGRFKSSTPAAKPAE